MKRKWQGRGVYSTVLSAFFCVSAASSHPFLSFLTSGPIFSLHIGLLQVLPHLLHFLSITAYPFFLVSSISCLTVSSSLFCPLFPSALPFNTCFVSSTTCFSSPSLFFFFCFSQPLLHCLLHFLQFFLVFPRLPVLFIKSFLGPFQLRSFHLSLSLVIFPICFCHVFLYLLQLFFPSSFSFLIATLTFSFSSSSTFFLPTVYFVPPQPSSPSPVFLSLCHLLCQTLQSATVWHQSLLFFLFLRFTLSLPERLLLLVELQYS